MAIQMELYELKNLCMEMASLGAANYVKQTIPAKDLISQREAYRLFQECRVKRWQKDGRVSTIRWRFYTVISHMCHRRISCFPTHSRRI